MVVLPTYIVTGSFDPFHLGHQFLVDSALKLEHSKVVILQACNPSKPKPRNTVGVIRDIYESTVEVATLPPNTLLAEFTAGNYENPVLVRGYRNTQDQDYEATLEQFNKSMGLRTLLLEAPQCLRSCSSTVIRGITGSGNVGFHNYVRDLMPKAAYTAFLENWIVEALGRVNLQVPSLRDLFSCYRESHRYYHTLCHIAHVLQELNRLRASGLGIGCEFDLAILFHEAVYDPTKSDNELQSCNLMSRWGMHLAYDHTLIRELIMCTAGHEAGKGRESEELLIACDLAILGRPAEEYRRYARGIRKEYSWVPDDVYRTERIKILEKLKTYRFPDYWPDPAYNVRLQSNIDHEIYGLQHNTIVVWPKRAAELVEAARNN